MTADIYCGHRDRMRKRLVTFGTRSLESYELLEILLYHAIPRKNTHPTAKLLLARFKGLGGVFSASKEQLCKIEGIGSKTADFLVDAGRLIASDTETQGTEKTDLSDYEAAGNFFVEYFEESKSPEVCIACLDSQMRLLGVKTVFTLDLSSGGVQAKPLLNYALDMGASLVILAHNHVSASHFATDGDRETNKMLSAAFAEIGIILAESYVISGRFFNGFIKNEPRQAKDSAFPEKCKKTDTENNTKDDSELKLIVSALKSRLAEEKFGFGKRHDEKEIMDFLIMSYATEDKETVSVLSLDGDGCVTAHDFLAGGTVNFASVLPRTVVEKAISRKAKSVMLAHNHPGGSCEASEEDRETTRALFRALELFGIKLLSHYVIGGGGIKKINY